MDLSIIIPAHNEESTISGPLFIDSVRWMRRRFPAMELIIVDDGSTDGTSEAAALVADQVLQQSHNGKGAALCNGILHANGECVVWADADWSVPVTEIPKLLEAIHSGADYVMGSRGWARPESPLFRWIGSCLYTIACRQAFDWEFTDTQCGMKAARLKSLQSMTQELQYFGMNIRQEFPSTDALFDVECLLVARKIGLQVSVIPVTWKHFRNRSSQDYLPLLRRISRDFGKVRDSYQSGLYY